MATYYETYRTNYFAVKNTKELSDILTSYDINHSINKSIDIEETHNLVMTDNGKVLIPPRQLMFIGEIESEGLYVYNEDR